MLIDAGSGDALAALPMEVPVTCDRDFVYTDTDNNSGNVFTQIERYAVLDVGDPTAQPDFWVYSCAPALPTPACPANHTCTGERSPTLYRDRCYLSRNTGTFLDGQLWVSCGYEYRSEIVGQQPAITSQFVDSLRVWIE